MDGMSWGRFEGDVRGTISGHGGDGGGKRVVDLGCPPWAKDCKF